MNEIPLQSDVENSLIGSKDIYEFHTSHRFFLTEFGLNDNNEIIILDCFTLHSPPLTSLE